MHFFVCYKNYLPAKKQIVLAFNHVNKSINPEAFLINPDSLQKMNLLGRDSKAMQSNVIQFLPDRMMMPRNSYNNSYENPTYHYGFKTKVKGEHFEEVLELIERGDLNSWKVVEVRSNQKDCKIVPRNSKHKNCNPPT